MRTWLELKEKLEEKDIAEADQIILRDLLLSFGFSKRQMLLGILMGFEENISFFVDLVKKKQELKRSPSEDLANDVLDMEKNEMDRLLEDLKK